MNFEPLIKHEGVAAPMMRNDLEVEFIASPLQSTMIAHALPNNTITPHKHSKTTVGSDAGKKTTHAFAAERFLPDGSENPDFILNQVAYRNASILLMGRNFGIGSMQLMASVQLLQCGFKAIIASSFGPTFYEDSVAVGLLPIVVSTAVLQRFRLATEQSPGSRISIDLEFLEMEHRDTGAIKFDLDESVRARFLRGGTDPRLLSEYEKQSEKVIADRRKLRPWLQ